MSEEGFAASQILDGSDPSLLTWREIRDSWGSCTNFVRSYGLKPYDLGDLQEAAAISRALAENRERPSGGNSQGNSGSGGSSRGSYGGYQGGSSHGNYGGNGGSSSRGSYGGNGGSSSRGSSGGSSGYRGNGNGQGGTSGYRGNGGSSNYRGGRR